MTSQAAFGPPFFRRCTILISMLATGCATERAYEGPRLPAGESVIVRADPVVSAGLPVQVRIRRADGREVGLSSSQVELPAGGHELVVDCRVAESGSVRRFTIAAELEAGGHYRLVASANARNCEAVELIAD